MIDFVPDTVGDICLRKPCDIHDCMWRRGVTYMDKVRADWTFYKNMRAVGAPIWLATLYYLSVAIGGVAAFRGLGSCPYLKKEPND